MNRCICLREGNKYNRYLFLDFDLLLRWFKAMSVKWFSSNCWWRIGNGVHAERASNTRNPRTVTSSHFHAGRTTRAGDGKFPKLPNGSWQIYLFGSPAGPQWKTVFPGKLALILRLKHADSLNRHVRFFLDGPPFEMLFSVLLCACHVK